MIVRARHWLALLALAFTVASPAAWAQGAPGVRLLAVVGEVQILGTDGATRAATRGEELRQGETIQTGQNALVQLRLADGGLLSVRADTELKLDRFAFAGRDDRDASFLASLLKGGFRAITGLISQANRDGYRITTPSATIGIRGTDFETLVLTTPRPELQMEAGTFARVHRGEIVVRGQDQASQIVRPDQSAFVGIGASAGPPRLVPIPPLLRTPTPMVQAPPSGTPPGADPAAKAEGARTGQTASPGGRGPDAPAAAIKPPASSPATTLQTAPVRSPTLTAPLTSPTTTIQTAPSTLQTTPITSPTLTAPTTPIQTAPSTLQTAPITSPTLTSPTTIQSVPPALQQAPVIK